MADTLINTLYPPVIETFQPAFVYTNPAVVTFSISPFNSAADIKYIHVSVVDQRNNENVLKETQTFANKAGIFNGIFIAQFPQFTNDQGTATDGIFVYDADSDLYSISISPNYLNQDENDVVEVETIVEDENTTDEEGNPTTTVITTQSHYFNVAQYYKVQIRFDCTTEDIATMQNKSGDDSEAAAFIANYMTNQRPYFSEWSEVTLVKPIYQPTLLLSKFDTTDETLAFNKGLIRIAGVVSFDGELAYEDNEHLQSYRLLVTNTNTQKVFVDTGYIYAQKSPEGLYGINYLLDMENSKEYDVYNLRIFLKTNNGYEMYKDYTFEIAEFYNGDFVSPYWNSLDWQNHPTDEVKTQKDILVNQEDGVVVIDFSCPQCESPGTLYIKRASSKDNYKNWQIISITKHKGNDVATKIVDYSVCSLHSYRYSAQYEYHGGLWSAVEYSNPVYIKFYEMLLMRQNRQIAIRYNGQLSSWKPVVNRQKVDTLGGKYPKFVENAIINYKQFAISGIISTEGDFNRKFLNEFDGEWVEQDDGSYEYEFYYQRDVQTHNDNFDSTYMIRNDTIADGEFGYLEKKAKDPNGLTFSHKGNLYLGDPANDFISDNTDAAIKDSLLTDDEYAYSIFDDTTYALNHQHDLTMRNNWYWEREFREQLVQWLNDGEPKLYRSMPEGNVVVMLNDINLTPVNNSRQLYNFSATLYEVGDGYDLENLDALGVINIPKIASTYVPGADYTDNPDSEEGDDLSYSVQRIGQMHLPQVWGKDLIKGGAADNDEPTWDDLTILERLKEQQAGYLKNSQILDSTLVLSDVKITFVSEPRWYEQTSPSSWSLWTQEDTTPEEGKNLWLGYLLTVNGQQVFVNSRGYYQIPTDTVVSSLELADGDEAVVDYVYTYRQQYNTSNIPKRTRLFKKIIGQQAGMFPANKAIGNDVKEKYALAEYSLDNRGLKDTTIPKFIQSLQYWKGICIDVSPYAVIGVTYKDETSYETYLIGRTGVLHLLEDTPVNDITFLGRRMTIVDRARQPYLDEWECILDESVSPLDPDSGDVNWYDLIENEIVDTGNLVYIAWSNEYDDRYPVYDKWVDISQSGAINGYGGDVANVPNPQYNNVYGISSATGIKYYIYYIDDKWYPVKLVDENTILAAVPVYGVVNYKGDLVRSEYE